MDNHEISIDTEPTANTTPLPLLPSSQTHEKDTDVSSWSEPLYDALKKNNWDFVKDILDRVPEAINGPVGPRKDTPLVVAIEYMRDQDTHIVEKLINMMPPEKLVYSKEEISWSERNESAIHWAANASNYSATKLLISTYPAVLNSVDITNQTPIQSALLVGNTDMACYMLKVASTCVQDLQELELTFTKDLENAIKLGKYDFAYILIQQCPKLSLHKSPWKILIEECDDFPCRRRSNMLQSIIYPWIRMNGETVSKSLTRKWKRANSRFTSATYPELQFQKHGDSQEFKESRMRVAWLILRILPLLVLQIIVWPIKSAQRLKLRQHQVLELVRGLCEEIKKFSDQDRLNIVQYVFCSAVQNGVYDIVEVILQKFPDAIEYKDEDGNNALQFAASHRDGKTFHLVHEHIKFQTHHIKYSVDNNGNNILHLVAKSAQRLGSSSGNVLQLQREFQWYKKLERILPYDLKFKKNSEKQVPFEVFIEEHKDMLKSESEWITSMANSCMVAGSLIAAVVFAAAITLPGGNKDNGFPIFSNDGALKVFAVSNAFALVSSLIAVVTFLSIFTTRYSAESFQYDLPNRLIFGLISLLLSVTFMMIAFSTTVHLLFAENYNWIIYPTAVISFMPVFFFGFLQLPSLLNIIKSTYRHDIFKDNNVTIFSME